MIGKNAVRLILPIEYSRLHTVFNVSLIMPYFNKTEVNAIPDKITDKISDNEASSFLVNWVAVESIIDHRFSGGIHQYLLRNNSRLNNEDDFWLIIIPEHSLTFWVL